MSSTSTSDMMPSQKDGVAMPAIATMRTIWSSQVFSLQRRDRAERDGDQDGDHRRHQGDLQRYRQPTGDLVRHRPARPHRRAEIEGEVAAQEVEELHDHRIVQAELQPAGVDRAWIDVRAARAQADDADVARDQAHQDEDQRRGPHQGGDREQQPLDDVAVHAMDYLSSQMFARSWFR